MGLTRSVLKRPVTDGSGSSLPDRIWYFIHIFIETGADSRDGNADGSRIYRLSGS